MDILERINSHDDLIGLTNEERDQLCQQIRQFLIASVAKTGGHLAGNLGAVELCVAIETVYNTNIDRLVFDVGHQSYVHKLLTGRRADFARLRQYGGISGFPKPEESHADAFVAGHASSSVSIALGMARARTLQKQSYEVVALIGDGACTGGMAYEGLNDAAVSGEPMVVILNDNEMAIGRNVGGMSAHLSKLRSSDDYLHAKMVYRNIVKKLPGGNALYEFTSRVKNRLKHFLLQTTIFENMGFTYLGPVDGHDLNGLIELLTVAKSLDEPVLVHVVTKKGFGYPYAEEDPAKFHGIGAYDPHTGKKLGAKVKTYSDSFGETMLELAQTDKRLCAITAAMPGGTGLLDFQRKFPERTFDVGIAEEHAISMAGGLAKQGMVPVVALYSTFLQRGFDQTMQDVALLHLPVVFAIDRAGLVGDDGPTHHGVFDIGFLRQAPGMEILVPASMQEQKDMLAWAVHYGAPVAIRYPRGSEGSFTGSGWSGLDGELVRCHREGDDVTLVTHGRLLDEVLEAAKLLAQQGIQARVLRLLSVGTLPAQEVYAKLAKGKPVCIFEETAANSGIWEALACQLRKLDGSLVIDGRDLGDKFVPHGSLAELYRHCHLDRDSIASFVKGGLGQ